MSVLRDWEAGNLLEELEHIVNLMLNAKGLHYSTIKVGFTGHRDKRIDENYLELLYKDLPQSSWIHGGAIGFDTQVANFAREHNIRQAVIRPDYEKYGKRAPLVRNERIVREADFMIACYDGRQTGGTYFTINYAKQVSKKVLIIRLVEEESY